MNKVELLAPAGDLEKLKMALVYGADAVYMGGHRFGLRASSKNFSIEEMKEAVEFAHSMQKKIYITLNMIPHNEDLEGLEDYMLELESLGVDAFIISDPGILMTAREVVPNMEIHLSTQANNTNYKSANFWYKQGVKRVVVARELSFEEISKIRASIPAEMDIEAFVHGAMCISYSGRCLMSNYMTGRDANKGACAHPCRWKYNLVEETRPGEYFPVYEDERGTYFFNSKDLCMIEYIPEIIQSGVGSLKVEGRMKTAYYVASVVRAYRMAIDSYYENPTEWKFDQTWMDELKKASYRGFTTGFYNDKPTSEDHNYGSSSYIRNYDFIGLVKGYDEEKNMVIVEQRNRFFKGDKIEVIGPNEKTIEVTVNSIFNEAGEELEVAPRPKEILRVDLGIKPKENFILRKETINE